MTVMFKYEAPINEYEYIPAGTEVKLIDTEDGFVIVEYNNEQYYFNSEYFVEVKSKLTV